MSELHTDVSEAVPPASERRGGWPLWTMPALIAVIVVLALGLTYLLAGGSAGPPREFDSPQAIAARLAELGQPCPNLQPIPDPVGAESRATCYIGTDQVIISVYADASDVEENWDLHRRILGSGADVQMVIGDYWSINADDRAWGRKAAQLLGGEYRTS